MTDLLLGFPQHLQRIPVSVVRKCRS